MFLNDTILSILMLVIPAVGLALYAFNRIRRQVRLERKLQQVSGGRQSLDHEEAIHLLEQRQSDMSVEQTLYRFLPTLSKTRMNFRRAGIDIDIKMYVFLLLAAVAALVQLVNIPSVPGWGHPIVFAFALHAAIDLVVLRILIDRRKEKMIDQLGVAIDYMSRGLQVGQSLESAIVDAAHAVEPPLRDKLLMVHKLTEVGISLPNALTTVAQDVDLPEFDFFVSAIMAQLQTGGSVVASLSNIVEIIRARKDLKARVAALSAEGKMSAYVLTALPIGLYAYIKAVRPDYMAPLEGTGAAPYVIGGAVALLIVGFAIMMMIARIKV